MPCLTAIPDRYAPLTNHPQHMRLTILFLSCFLSFKALSQYQPKDYAIVGGQKSGDFLLGAFKAQHGVAGQHFIRGNHWESSRVDSFRVAIFRDSLLLFYYHNKGNVWNPDLAIRLKELEIGDRIMIFDIRASWPNIPRLFLPPLEYVMK